MRKLTRSEKKQLQAKIQEQRQQRHRLFLERARQMDEEDMGMAMIGTGGRGLFHFLKRYIVELIPDVNFRTRLVLALLLFILLPLAFALILIAVFRYVF